MFLISSQAMLLNWVKKGLDTTTMSSSKLQWTVLFRVGFLCTVWICLDDQQWLAQVDFDFFLGGPVLCTVLCESCYRGVSQVFVPMSDSLNVLFSHVHGPECSCHFWFVFLPQVSTRRRSITTFGLLQFATSLAIMSSRLFHSYCCQPKIQKNKHSGPWTLCTGSNKCEQVICKSDHADQTIKPLGMIRQIRPVDSTWVCTWRSDIFCILWFRHLSTHWIQHDSTWFNHNILTTIHLHELPGPQPDPWDGLWEFLETERRAGLVVQTRTVIIARPERWMPQGWSIPKVISKFKMDHFNPFQESQVWFALAEFDRGKVYWGSDFKLGTVAGVSELRRTDDKRFSVMAREGVEFSAHLENFQTLAWEPQAH